ncbi:hypothetical protein Tco_1562102 [Tanacetum coccineum]
MQRGKVENATAEMLRSLDQLMERKEGGVKSRDEISLRMGYCGNCALSRYEVSPTLCGHDIVRIRYQESGIGDSIPLHDYILCYAYSESLLLAPLCCDDIHEVTPRVSALAGCDTGDVEAALSEGFWT